LGVRPEQTQVKHITVLNSKVRLLALPGNIKLDRYKRSSLFFHIGRDEEKSFIRLMPNPIFFLLQFKQEPSSFFSLLFKHYFKKKEEKKLVLSFIRTCVKFSRENCLQ
jgi:hypothetical protein